MQTAPLDKMQRHIDEIAQEYGELGLLMPPLPGTNSSILNNRLHPTSPPHNINNSSISNRKKTLPPPPPPLSFKRN